MARRELEFASEQHFSVLNPRLRASSVQAYHFTGKWLNDLNSCKDELNSFASRCWTLNILLWTRHDH